MRAKRSEAATSGQRRIAEQDHGALRRTIEPGEGRVTAGAALMRDARVTVPGEQIPVHAHPVAADTGDLFLRSHQGRRDRALARAELALEVPQHVRQRRADAADASHVGRKIPRYCGHRVGEVTLGQTDMRWALGHIGFIHPERNKQTFAQ